jgi:hypothetical protein
MHANFDSEKTAEPAKPTALGRGSLHEYIKKVRVSDAVSVSQNTVEGDL